jgi:Ca-activated chloride channel homolog
MGQHSLPSRHPVGRALLVLLAAVLLLGTYLQVRPGRDATAATCDGPALPLVVGAEAEVAPWLGELARAYAGEGRRVHGRCVGLTVRTVTAEALPTARVHAWVAVSGTSAALAAAGSPELRRVLAAPGVPVAFSPVVLGLPAELADRLRAGGRDPGLAELLALTRDPAGWGDGLGPVRFSTPDPGGTAVGAGFVVAAVGALTGRPPQDVDAAAFARADVRTGLLELVRAMAAAPATTRELLERAAAAGDPAALLRTVGVLAVPERDLWRYTGPVPLRALYPFGGLLAADSPYQVLDGPWVDGDARAAAADFRDWLRSPAVQDRLGGFGLRRADGTAPPGLDGHGLDTATVAPGPPVAVAGPAAARAAWALVTRPVSTLTVVDVSASTGGRAPGGKTRLQLVKEAGTAVLRYAGDADSVGLWEFSAGMVGKRDFRQLVALGTAGSRAGRHPDRRAAIASAYRGMRPRPGAGLYDTVLAAYRTALDDYRPDAVNTVLVVSDGGNEDPGSVSLAGTVARLRAWYRPSRPVHVVTVAYGTAADRTALAQLARATRGTAYATADPRRLTPVLTEAITALPAAHP